MSKTTDWIKETNELLKDWEFERQNLHSKYEQLANELMDLEKRIEAGYELVGAYMRKHAVESTTPDTIKQGSLANKTYPEMLAEIAKQSNMVLNVSDATEILFNAHVGTSKEQIRHSIYNTIARFKKHFTNIGRGQYRFTNHLETRVKKQPALHKHTPTNSGLRQVVKQLKEAHPEWTWDDTYAYLKQTAFEFKTKYEKNALNVTWANLGYTKEGKQQALPIPTSPTNN